jgi:hypothetical protein
VTIFPVTKERIIQALRLLEHAIAIDPHYGPALSWAAMCHYRFVTDGWAEAPEESRRNGVDLWGHNEPPGAGRLMLAKPTLRSFAQYGTRPQRITSRLRSPAFVGFLPFEKVIDRDEAAPDASTARSSW